VSDLPPNPYSPESQGVPTRRQRPASVQLRSSGDEGTDLATLMDPATRSLADALRITYRILQLGMVALVVIFLFSGVKSVQTSEKGVRLLLGKIEDDNLPPGLQITLPAPFGELVTVPSGVETLKLESEFWPNLPENDRRKSPEELKNSPRGKLDPATDGSIITADGSLAHARFTVTYKRDNVRNYLASVQNREQAERLVRSAVMRGVVHAAAGVTIDEFWSDRADTQRTGRYQDIAATARALAQKTLDDMRSGIRLEDLSIQDRTPPIDVINTFQQVQTDDAKAAQQRNLAEEERAKTLAAAAGQNADALLKLIDRYDTALTTQDEQAAEGELRRIDDLLDGKELEIDGVKVQGIGGMTSATLSSAHEYRSSIVSRAQSDAALFEVKRQSFINNPQVMMTGEWTEAYRKFLKQEKVEILSLPPNTTTIELLLNIDPTLRRQQAIKAQAEAGAKKAAEDTKTMEQRKFSTEKKPAAVSGQ
jgi:regulator of protease activity HflC (stomatin/prohibitin superfamily)